MSIAGVCNRCGHRRVDHGRDYCVDYCTCSTDDFTDEPSLMEQRVYALEAELAAARKALDLSGGGDFESAARVTTECNGGNGFGSCRGQRDPEYCAACDTRRYIVRLTRAGDTLSEELAAAKAEIDGLKAQSKEDDIHASDLLGKLEAAKAENQRLCQPPEIDDWKAVVRLAYADAGDGVTRIQHISSAYVHMQDERDKVIAALKAVAFDRPWHGAWMTVCRKCHKGALEGLEVPHAPDCVVGNALPGGGE